MSNETENPKQSMLPSALDAFATLLAQKVAHQSVLDRLCELHCAWDKLLNSILISGTPVDVLAKRDVAFHELYQTISAEFFAKEPPAEKEEEKP